MAVCLDLSSGLAKSNSKEWKQACNDLSGYWKIMDIIFYGDQTLKSENLTIPHPRMHLRRFVLQPLCDLVPDFVHPIFNKELKRLLNELDPGEQPVEEMDV